MILPVGSVHPYPVQRPVIRAVTPVCNVSRALANLHQVVLHGVDHAVRQFHARIVRPHVIVGESGVLVICAYPASRGGLHSLVGDLESGKGRPVLSPVLLMGSFHASVVHLHRVLEILYHESLHQLVGCQGQVELYDPSHRCIHGMRILVQKTVDDIGIDDGALGVQLHQELGDGGRAAHYGNVLGRSESSVQIPELAQEPHRAPVLRQLHVEVPVHLRCHGPSREHEGVVVCRKHRCGYGEVRAEPGIVVFIVILRSVLQRGEIVIVRICDHDVICPEAHLIQGRPDILLVQEGRSTCHHCQVLRLCICRGPERLLVASHRDGPVETEEYTADISRKRE